MKVDMRELKKAVMGSIEEYTVVLESSSEEMAEKAKDHVLLSDTVITFKYSGSATLQVNNIISRIFILFRVS